MSLVDASVIVAILNEEAGFEELEKRIEEAGPRLFVSPLVRFEAGTAMMKIELLRSVKPRSMPWRPMARWSRTLQTSIWATASPTRLQSGIE